MIVGDVIVLLFWNWLIMNIVGCGRNGIKVSLASTYACRQVKSLIVNICVKFIWNCDYMRDNNLVWFEIENECGVFLICKYMRGYAWFKRSGVDVCAIMMYLVCG